MNFICPVPRIWHEIYVILEAHWINVLKKEVPAPPKPLILGGWNFSNDYDKKDRWEQTINWVSVNNCKHLLPVLDESDKYYIREMSSWIPFQYSNWNEVPRIRPTDSEIEAYLIAIKKAWPTILDPKFGLNTSPKKMTGKKARRLLVVYQKGYKPPWGSWEDHLANGLPSKFTVLRKKVNEIIAPHEVDHIEFEEVNALIQDEDLFE